MVVVVVFFIVPKEDLAIANTQNKRKNRSRVEDAARLVMLMEDVHRSRIEEAARLFMLMEDAHRSRVEEAGIPKHPKYNFHNKQVFPKIKMLEVLWTCSKSELKTTPSLR